MGNDRDDKFEGHEESEYHFSDDEANYEIETETEKQVSDTGDQKENILARLTRSKRMLISLGVFLVLIFVVYKMIAPSSSVPSTNITSAPTIAQNTGPITTQAPPAAPVQTQSAPSAPAVSAAPIVPPVPGAMAQQQAAVPPAPVVMQPPSQVPAITAQTGAVMPAAPVMPNSAVTSQVPTQPTNIVQPAMQPAAQIAQPAAVPPMQQIVANPIPTYIESQPVITGGKTDQQTMVLASDVDKLMAQAQTAYVQKLNDYSNQNKALQEQVQTLNSKVANIENQLNQLVHLLTRQQGINNSAVTPPPPPQMVDLPKAAYNVQAIIPGRAWLKSDNGETVTVAEGDVIKDMGRVTKIDPYDGLVEINTGNKVISLSYGNGG